MSQQVILAPLGIITMPNDLGQYKAGALKIADYALMRAPGTIECAPAWTTITAGINPSAKAYVFSVGTSLLFVYNFSGGEWATWYTATTGAFLFTVALNNGVSGGIAHVVDTTARFGLVTVRDRTLLLCNRGTLAWDYTTPGSSAQANARTAGLMPPRLNGVAPVTSGSPGAMKGGTYCHVVCILRRKFADGYEIFSAPSVSAMAVHLTNDFDIQLDVTCDLLYAQTGDVVEVYRTRAQPITATGGTNTGPNYYLSTSYTISVIGGSFTFNDTVSDNVAPGATGLGEALYTNTGVKGGDAGAFPPPTAKALAQFRGHTFYANRTDPAFIRYRIPVFIGPMGLSSTGVPAFFRKNGIGARTISGSSAIGSNTITGISAGDIVGIVVGQIIVSAAFVANTTVTAVGATTITLSANASSVVTTHTLYDVIQVGDGTTTLSLLMSDTVMSATLSTIHTWAFCLERIFPDAAALVASGTPSTIPADYSVLTKLFFSGAPASTDNLTIRATNGWNYLPRLPRIENAETALTLTPTNVPNGIAWSEKNQPENCPVLNIDNVGKGEIYGCWSTRDALWFFCSDGLFRLSGTGGKIGSGYDWRLDPVDSTLVLSGPQAACVLRDTVYAYTSRGFVSVDSSGAIEEISHWRIGDQLPGPIWSSPTYNINTGIFCVADENNDEVILREPNATGFRVWRYNTLTDAFTQDIPSATGISHMCYSPARQALVGAILDSATSGTTRLIAPTTTLSNMDLTFQPVYAESPFVQRHWQKVEPIYVSSGGSSLQVTCYLNGLGTATGTRTLTSGGVSIDSRVGFTVQRNAPAVANKLQLLLLLSQGISATSLRMNGVALSYADITDQRKNR